VVADTRALPARVTAAGAADDPVLAEQARWLQQPYTPLELEGRDLYVAEGCYNCHSQMIRPFRHEVLRYGDYSRLEESLHDRPFQWGSKRTGPDLARVGGKYNNLWHYLHFMDPRQTSPGSNMPAYPWFKDKTVALEHTARKLEVLHQLGTPYSHEDIARARQNALRQGREIAADLAAQGIEIAPDSQMAAMIAYMQRLGIQEVR
jgi:cytochrome c oxidase cbb3-type subunit I/II